MRALLAILLLLPLAACDETTDPHAEIDLVVDDAVAARQNGDYDRAVALLRGALSRRPDAATVRVELATTLLERDGLDLVDLDRIGQFLTDAGAGAASAQAASNRTASAQATSTRRGDACTLADDPSATVIDPTAAAGFAEVQAELATLAEADSALSPVIPEALQGFSLCTSVVDGKLVYDRERALRELAEAGLSDAQIAQALAVNALTAFLGAYTTVASGLAEQATWYRRSDGSVAICVAGEAAARATAEAAVADVGEAVLSLDARASVVGAGSVAAEVVSLALDAYERLREAVGDPCETQS